MKLLFLSWWLPYPPDNGIRQRNYHLLRELARAHEVTLLSFAEDGEATPERTAPLEAICARVQVLPKPQYNPGGARALAGFFHPWPRWLVDVYTDAMQQLVLETLQGAHYDLVLAAEFSTTPYALSLRGVRRVFEGVEIAFYRDQVDAQTSTLRRLRYKLTWLKLVRYLRRVRRAFDGCTAVSDLEAAIIEQVTDGGGPLAVIENGVDTAAHAGDYGPPEPDTLIYPGALSYFANYDAASWFAGEILPRIAAARAEVRFRITGSTRNVDLSRFPASEHVHFTGYLDDIKPTLARSWACVVPVRHGSGTRLKILEAMAAGVPVVSTTKGAEGLEVTPGRDLLIADEPAAFADAVLRVLGDADLRQSLAEAGRQLVTRRYDWSIIGDRLLAFVDEVCAVG